MTVAADDCLRLESEHSMVAGAGKIRNRSLPLRARKRHARSATSSLCDDGSYIYGERNGVMLRGQRAKVRKWVLEPTDIGVAKQVSAVDLMGRCESDHDAMGDSATLDSA